MRPVVVRISTVRLALAIGVRRVVGVDLVASAVVFQTGRAVWAVRPKAAASLSADTDAVTDREVLDVGANPDGFANDLMTDAAGYLMSVLEGLGWER